MNLSWILFGVILMIGISVPSCQGFLNPEKFQEFVDKYVDIEKFKQEGLKSLNSTAWEHIWNYFKTKFNRHYGSSGEEKDRIQIFRQHLKEVLNSNIKNQRSFHLGLNKFSDWTKEEFDKYKKGLKIPAHAQESAGKSSDEQSMRRRFDKLSRNSYSLTRTKRNVQNKREDTQFVIPDWFWDFFFNRDDNDNNNNNDDDGDNDNNQTTEGFDWRTKNVVSPVKNQKNCGSCYAFASVEVMESIYAIKTGSEDVPILSPQQIVDCSSDHGNNGCNGGNFEPTVEYLQAQGGKLATEDSYPYSGSEGTCKESSVKEIELGNIKWGQIPIGNEKRLATELVKNGPVFIGLDVESDLFMFYESGVLSIPNCPNTPNDMDHALVIVGYGYDEDSQKSYWIIRNSWGNDWGENGYLRLEKDAGNMCGVTTMAYFATLE